MPWLARSRFVRISFLAGLVAAIVAVLTTTAFIAWPRWLLDRERDRFERAARQMTVRSIEDDVFDFAERPITGLGNGVLDDKVPA